MFRLATDDLLVRRRGIEDEPRGQWGEANVQWDLDHAQPLVTWLERSIQRPVEL
jgi:hypothetical protein